jgi:mRNA interferase MazF
LKRLGICPDGDERFLIPQGDLVTFSLSGDFGKPRLALVIQSDAFSSHPSATILSLTSDLFDAPNIRVTVQPDMANGLRLPSQIMIDRAATLRRDKIGQAHRQDRLAAS